MEPAASPRGVGNSTSFVCVFIIVGAHDVPIFECDLSRTLPGSAQREDTPHLDQFILHAALDVVDELAWQSSNLYLRQVDRFNDFVVSAYMTPGRIKFLLLHRVTSGTTLAKTHDDNIHEFFAEIHELYLKTLLNPFYELHSLLAFPAFEAKLQNVLAIIHGFKNSALTRYQHVANKAQKKTYKPPHLLSEHPPLNASSSVNKPDVAQRRQFQNA